MLPNTRCIKRFSDRTINPRRSNQVAYQGRNVFCEDRFLYSYGRHFPLARYLGEKGKKHLFLKNGDKYSDTTSKHQGETQQHCFGPTVSRAALESAGFKFNNIEFKDILCWQPDLNFGLYKNKRTGKYFDRLDYTGKHKDNPVGRTEVKPPKQGMFVPSVGDPGEKNYIWGHWHSLGVVVFQLPGKMGVLPRYFLASLDESRYFVSELPARPRNVKHAFQLLQPPEVQTALKAKKKVLRQGEWFFVPTGLNDAALAAKLNLTQKKLHELATEKPLPIRDGQENGHCCRWIQLLDASGKGPIYARGKVFHRHQGTTTTFSNEHKTVRLGENLDEWYLVYRNTEVNSWSMGGNFD